MLGKVSCGNALEIPLAESLLLLLPQQKLWPELDVKAS